MLFQKILDKKYQEIWPQFELLYSLVIERQTHDGDLLLVTEKAFHNADIHNWKIWKERYALI